MPQPSGMIDEILKRQLVSLCRSVAKARPITGICVCGDYALGLMNSKAPIEIMLIIEGFQPRLMNYIKFLKEKTVVIYAVDKWVFERDVDDGFLGEAFAVHLLFPYIPLTNKDYFKAEEAKLKKRVTRELLENLVLEYPELSRVLYIKPEYFVYEALMSRARLFPPLFYAFSSFLREGLRSDIIKVRVVEGYVRVLEELEKERIVKRLDGYVKVSEEFADSVKSQKTRFVNLLKSAQKTLFLSLLKSFPNFLKVLSQDIDVFLKLQLFENENSKYNVKDPKVYLLAPTAKGLVPLAKKMDIKDFARKIFSENVDYAKIEVERLGGVLNDVYLVKVAAKDKVEKVVAKSFKDWSDFKWFPLTLWTFGTKSFALLGQSRLERECAISQLLYSKGFSVPKLLGISSQERLVFMEYLEGESLEKIVKNVMSSKPRGEKDLRIVEKVGETFAKIHALGVTLGDTKPENILIGTNGEIYLLDFEQASRKGDKAWDIAEFLYYVGHYASPFTSIRLVELIAKTFIKGYLSAGGDLKSVRAAGKPKYTKVFAIFALPNVVLAISRICRKADVLRQKHGEK